jgi:hypothetical protein
VTLYHCKALFCELCKKAYPTIFMINKEAIEILDVKRPIDKEYAVIEAYGKDTKTVRAVYVIPGKDEVKLVCKIFYFLRVEDMRMI